MGSSTGAYMAGKLGRQFVGYDTNWVYVEFSDLRVAQAPMPTGPMDGDLSFHQSELRLKWQEDLLEGEEAWKS